MGWGWEKRFYVSLCEGNVLLLGIDYEKYSRVEDVTPTCIEIPTDEEIEIFWQPPAKNPEKDDVVFCLAFVLESILEWQKNMVTLSVIFIPLQRAR